jgi:hypothetical protein
MYRDGLKKSKVASDNPFLKLVRIIPDAFSENKKKQRGFYETNTKIAAPLAHAAALHPCLLAPIGICNR